MESESFNPKRLLRLRGIIAEHSMRRGQFTLASGIESDIFFNLKPAMLLPEAINIIADEMLDRLAGDKVDFIGGLEMGAVPIIVAVCAKSFERRTPIPSFFVRKAVKDHGTRELIEGNLQDHSNVVIVEDVTTTGGSALKAAAAVRERGCRILKIMTIIDRLEGAFENLAAQNLSLVSLFTKKDFLEI